MARPKPNGERLLTIKEVADYLRCDPKTVRRLITERALAAYKIGREWRVSDSDLRKFLSDRWSG